MVPGLGTASLVGPLSPSPLIVFRHHLGTLLRMRTSSFLIRFLPPACLPHPRAIPLPPASPLSLPSLPPTPPPPRAFPPPPSPLPPPPPLFPPPHSPAPANLLLPGESPFPPAGSPPKAPAAARRPSRCEARAQHGGGGGRQSRHHKDIKARCAEGGGGSGGGARALLSVMPSMDLALRLKSVSVFAADNLRLNRPLHLLMCARRGEGEGESGMWKGEGWGEKGRGTKADHTTSPPPFSPSFSAPLPLSSLSSPFPPAHIPHPIALHALPIAGHFLLTNLLLPKLKETAKQEGAEARIVVVSSVRPPVPVPGAASALTPSTPRREGTTP
ncbi:unnamed protein product [Closterium sp. Naga37s-1]|nr:unnamed protein product [Closterium sp. Naga37s-1]